MSSGGDFSFDDTDLAIVDLLRRNGRATNQQIAEDLGLTATTVSARIRRMEDANQLRVVAVSDFAAHGFDVLIQIKIEVDNRPVSEVATELAAFSEVFAAHVVTGSYDIDLLVTLKELGDLHDFMFERLAKVHGIRTITPSIAVDILKYRFDKSIIQAG
ncbi:MAG: Lrp/AsnC family transcriptional regulator [Sphingopyxis sp.]|jgi:Lrp/AsnC family leucine-responsive transcriptional regulator|uniref:Lrp/AsnC family transcriptional regulator n=1 Tax=Sphingopyxis sp. TaxID=1908224 RepID=UPI0032ED5FD4